MNVCWECGKEGANKFDLKKAEYLYGEFWEYVPVSQRCYCDECFTRVVEERKADRDNYVRLKKKLMFERAVRLLERQDVDLYEYKEALEVVRKYSSENLNMFDSADEMVAAAVLIKNGKKIKTQHKVGAYRVDFYIPSMKIVLEIDGDRHKYSKKRDSERDIKIRQELGQDVEIIRIDTKYIEANAKMLVEAIKTLREERQKLRSKNFGYLPEWYKR